MKLTFLEIIFLTIFKVKVSSSKRVFLFFVCRINEAYKGDESLDASVVTRYAIQKILEGIQYVLNVFVDCIICPPLGCWFFSCFWYIKE